MVEVLKCPLWEFEALTEAGMMNHLVSVHRRVALTDNEAQFFKNVGRVGL